MKFEAIHFTLALSFLNGAATRAAPRVSLPLFALDLGAQPVLVGLLAASFSVFPMMTAVPAGRLADRFGSRWLVMVGSLIGAVGMLVPFLWPGMTSVFVAAALTGLSTGVCEVSLQNLVGLQSTPANRSRHFSNYSLMGSLANFGGPMVAGFSIDLSGHPVTCLYLALLALVPIAMLAFGGEVLPGGTRKAKHAGGGLRDLLSEPGVRRTLATSSLLQTGKDLFQYYLPVYMHAIGLSASVIGVVISMNAAAAFVVRLFLPGMIAKYKEEKVLVHAFLVSAATLVLLPFFQSAVVLGIISFIFGFGMGSGQPVITMLMFTNSAEGRSGEALGLRMTVIHLTKIVVPIAFGSVATAVGLPALFWLNGGMLGVGGMLSRTGKIPRRGGHSS